MRLLVDCDDVILNWSEHYDASLNRRAGVAQHFGDIEAMLIVGSIRRSEEHTQWDLFADLTPEASRVVHSVLAEPRFYADLQPIPGALEALEEMRAAGHEVHIVTSPMPSNPTCADDKLSSIERHLGPYWRKRVVITEDKTIVHGDVLFDDRAEITGSMAPSWRQVIVDQPHNRRTSNPAPRIADLSGWALALEVLA